jgi:hypothetical protein
MYHRPWKKNVWHETAYSLSSLKKEVSDDGVEVASKRVGLTNLTIRIFKCIKNWCFQIIFDNDTRWQFQSENKSLL